MYNIFYILGLPGQRGPKGMEKIFWMIDFIYDSYLIGEPAQALPGFKGEIVSFQKKKVIKN